MSGRDGHLLVVRYRLHGSVELRQHVGLVLLEVAGDGLVFHELGKVPLWLAPD